MFLSYRSHLLQLNTSRIGQGDAFNTTDGDGGFFDNLINSAQDEANDLISGAADEAAEALNITDFYTVHIMNYCEGFFRPNATADNAKKNTTFCSSRKALFHFNPTQIIEDSLPDNIGLSDIQWPEEIQNASRAVRIAGIVMFVFYVVGIAFAGLAVITALLATFAEGHLSALANFLMDIVSRLVLLPVPLANISSAWIPHSRHSFSNLDSDHG
jgi:SUR7/PalI family